jgi:PKHD-type hydroxylase
VLLHIPEVFTKDEVRALRATLDAGPWTDGNATSGHQSALAKRNAQLPEASPQAQEVGAIIEQALQANPMFVSAALPHTIYPPLFNRYEGGQAFGVHVDNAIRQQGRNGVRIRSDLSATLFLSEPEDYDGGELLIEENYGSQSVKLPAGDMVLYPSKSLHRVQGCRASSGCRAWCGTTPPAKPCSSSTSPFSASTSTRVLPTRPSSS